MKFIHSIQSEWLKTKRTAAFWLCLIGGIFMPLIFFIASMYKWEVPADLSSSEGWQGFILQMNSNLAVFLLPFGLILTSSLLTHIEYKNNTWKQWLTLPIPVSYVYFSKWIVMVLITLAFFIYFLLGILVSGTLAQLIIKGSLPAFDLPVLFILKFLIKGCVACVALLTFQFLLGLLFKNVLVSIGIGILSYVVSAITFQKNEWWTYLNPCVYTTRTAQRDLFTFEQLNLYPLICTAVLLSIGYLAFKNKRQLG